MSAMETRESNRSAVAKLLLAGHSAGAIFKMLEPSGISRRFVYRTIKRISETGSIKDRKRTDRPRTVRTSRLKRVVSDQICRNPRRSMRKMAAELDVNRESLRLLVVKD